jgi:hypothetical protein
MTDRNQFEAMLEALINEDQEAAKEIFHNIVVAKSREIYEELLESDFSEGITAADTGANPYGKEEEEGEEEEGEEEGEEEEGEDDGADDVDGDAGDDFVSDVDDGEEGGEGEGDIEDRVMDLEDALEELKAEFEQLMAGEEHEEEQNPDIHGHEMDDIPGFQGGDEGPEMGADEGQGDVMHHVHHVMEYVNKVPAPKHGDNGVNNKSAVAGPNRMGGTSANIAQNFSTTTGGATNGLLKGSTTLQDAGNMNKPGADAGKKGFKTGHPGYGGIDQSSKMRKQGANVGAETGENSRDGEKNTKSIISTRVR